ncbi:MAG: fluoride efflux transporter CrcB [Actinomycetota bacterium]
MTVLAIGIGGALGALARYGVDLSVARRTEALFPWATLAVNVSGSFALGLLFVLLIEDGTGPDWLRGLLATGFLGAFTTFSTFSVQTVALAERGHSALAIGYIFASVLLGVFAAGAAILATRISPLFGWVGAGMVAFLAVMALTRD